MCKVSINLKLCSCKIKGVKKPKHYWILKRPNGKENWILGQAMLPADIGEDATKFNISTIKKMLNEGNCFDVALQHQEKDILELHFTVDASVKKDTAMPHEGNYLAYAFVYRKNKWRKAEYDPFSENLDDVQKGKIKKAFERNV